MRKGRTTDEGWLPHPGSYEESVLNWHEQIDEAFRRREGGGNGSGRRMRSQRGSTITSFRAASGRQPIGSAGGP